MPVQRSTSDCLDVCSQGLTRRKGTKRWGSGPAEDLLPVSEVEAGQLRGQVVVQSPRAATETRFQEVTGYGHTFPPPGGSRYPSCHLGADWTSSNQWAGRRCAAPMSRGSEG